MRVYTSGTRIAGGVHAWAAQPPYRTRELCISSRMGLRSPTSLSLFPFEAKGQRVCKRAKGHGVLFKCYFTKTKLNLFATCNLTLILRCLVE